jgi:hypothetical protein
MSDDFTIKDSGERRTFATGAQRDRKRGKGRYNLLPVLALRRVARHYEGGAQKYSARNWEKGMPYAEMADSLIRHAFQYLEGLTTEDHLAAVCFNALGIMEYEERAALGLLSQGDLDGGMGALWHHNRGAQGAAEPSSISEIAPGDGTIVRDIGRHTDQHTPADQAYMAGRAAQMGLFKDAE